MVESSWSTIEVALIAITAMIAIFKTVERW